MTQFPFASPAIPTAAPAAPQIPAIEDHEAELFAQIAEAVRADLDATVDVQRSVPGAGRTFLGSIPAGVFSKEAIQEKWGGGRYCCQLKVGGKWTKAATFNVEAPARPATATDVAPARPGGADGSALDFLRDELRFQRELMMQMLSARAQPANDNLMPLVTALIQQNSGPGQFGKAVELVMQLQGVAGQADRGGGGMEGMLEALALKVIERMDRPRPARQLAATPAAQAAPAATVATPVAAAAATTTPVAPAKASPIWPPAMIAAEEALHIPLRAMATDLDHGAASSMDAETMGIVLFRRLLAARPIVAADAGFFEEFDEALATRNMVEWVPSLAPHRDWVQSAVEAMVGLVMGHIEEDSGQEANA